MFQNGGERGAGARGLSGARLELLGAEGLAVDLGPVAIIGRDAACDLQLDDRDVAPRHASVTQSGAAYVLRELGTEGATRVNGRQVAEVWLRHGDVIEVGSSRVRFCAPRRTVPGGRMAIVPGHGESGEIVARYPCPADREFRPFWEVRGRADLAQDYERLRVAYRVNRAICRARDLDALLGAILDEAFNFLPADQGAILLAEREGEEPALRACKVREPDAGPPDVVISRTVLELVTRGREAVLCADASLDERFMSAESVVEQRIRSVMTVPMIHAGTLHGLLHLDTRGRTGAFGVKDLEILTAIADQAASAIDNLRMARELAEQARTRAELERILSPVLVERVLDRRLSLERGGELRAATILFLDIRGFTALAKRASPEDVVRLLNECFEALVDVVFAHEGLLDKFIGDALMAVWGVPESRPDHARLAVRAALEMQRAIGELNRSGGGLWRHGVRVGVGLDTGEVIAGAMGSSRRMEYTVVGNAVNFAAHLCDFAGPGEVLISERTAAGVGPGLSAELREISGGPAGVLAVVGLEER